MPASLGISASEDALAIRDADLPPKPHHTKPERAQDPAATTGVDLSISYVADYFQNLRGGLNTNQAEQFRGLAVLEATIDTEQLALWEGGTFFVSVINNHGTDITQRHVGDLQAVNNADAANDTRLYEVWYEHRMNQGALRLKVGKMDANAEFAAADFGLEFIHSSSGFSPTIPFPTWPDPALGIMLSLEPSNEFYLRGAVYDANGVGTRSGFESAFHSPEEVVVLAEVGVGTLLSLFGQGGLEGTYRLGGFYHGGRWERYPDSSDREDNPRLETGNAGVYLVLDQQLYRERPEDAEDEQGLGGFIQFGWAPSNRNEISQHYGFGMQYIGLLPERDEDVAGFALHHVSLSGRVQSLERRYSETAFEAFYKIHVSDELSIKPDVQYVINPGGRGRDALLAGVRVEFSF